MATAQKRGFRFPWGSEGRRDASGSPEHADVSEPTLAQRIGTVPDDLGRGPFDLGTTAVAEEPPAETWDAVEPVDSDADSAPGAASVGAAEERGGVLQDGGAVETSVPPEPDPRLAAQPAPAAAAEAASPAADAPTTGTAPTATAATASSAWPESDRRAARPAIHVAPPQTPPAPRRDNKLMSGLVRVMRDAARVARDEAVNALRTEAAERAAAIRAQSTATTASLRRSAEGDVGSIREWSKAEIARIREETEARIGARKVRLAGETEQEAKASEDRLAQLAAAVQAYEAETATFFDALLAEDDPARLAGLAERMPSPPALDAIVKVGTAAATKGSPAPARSRSAKLRATTQPAERRNEPAAAPELVADDPELADALDVPDALDAEDAAAAEAEALAGLDGHTQVIASGLVGVAAIASFKAALLRSPGVSAVSVNAGSDGDVLYSVTHAGDTDVRDALRQMETFQTRLIADDGATVVVVVHEAAA
jgi:hypothetical protein